MIENKDASCVKKRVVIAGLNLGASGGVNSSMDELKSLTLTTDREIIGMVVQNAEAVNKRTYFGSGKVVEMHDFIKANEVAEIIVNDNLSPAQLKNLQDEADVTVLDRTDLILEIFAMRAGTAEAKLQVEAAKLKNMLPKLVGLRDALGRQGGSSGSMSNKGVGEKKIELDRRYIQHRITEIDGDLKKFEQNRLIQRKSRDNSGVPKVALAGYTNAGKSTIFNRLVSLNPNPQNTKTVFEADMLFATLDSNVRMIEDDKKRPYFLSDTVGFIDRLPHLLVKAFRSTLDEVRMADLIVIVVDFSDPDYKDKLDVTLKTLNELGADDIKTLIVYNKIDKAKPTLNFGENTESMYISALDKSQILELNDRIRNLVYPKMTFVTLKIPYENGADLNLLCNKSTEVNLEYVGDGVIFWGKCSQSLPERFKKYTYEAEA